jgi:hypothetical protein
MNKAQFKQLHRKIRLIKNSMVGKYGHLSDLVTEFNVTIDFCRTIRESMSKPKRAVYGKYTAQYQDDQNYIANCESYYEKMVGA